MKKIIFLLILILFPFTTIACVEIPTFKVAPSQEKGDFIFENHIYNQFLRIDRTKHPDTEFFINNEMFGDIGEDNNIYIDLYDKYSKPYFPPKINVSVKQNGKEIYSAKWKVYDTTHFLSERASPFIFWLFLILLFGLALKLSKIERKLKIKIFLIFCVLMFSLFYYASGTFC